MKDITTTLLNAGFSTISYPVAKLEAQAILNEVPELFAGSPKYYPFDFCELNDNTYFRCRINNTIVEWQRILNPKEEAQWTSWTTLSGASPVGNTQVACAAIPTGGVRVFLLEAYDSTNHQFVFYETADFSTWTRVALPFFIPVVQSATRLAAADWQTLFYTKEYFPLNPDRTVGRVRCWICVISEDNPPTWKGYQNWAYFSWDFHPDKPEHGIDAIKLDEARSLVVLSAPCIDPYKDDNKLLSPQPFYFIHSRPKKRPIGLDEYRRWYHFWGQIDRILPFDSVPPKGKPDPEEHDQVRLSKIGGVIFCHIRSKYVLRSDYEDEFRHSWYVSTTDGKVWTIDYEDRPIGSTQTKTQGQRIFLFDGYLYEVFGDQVRRGKAALNLGYSSPLDITDYTLSFKISKPSGYEATTAKIEIDNVEGRFNFASELEPGSFVSISGGYFTDVGSEMIPMFSGVIDVKTTKTSEEANRIILDCRGPTRLLKQKASRPNIHLSQMRFFKEFDDEGDLAYFVTKEDTGVYWSIQPTVDTGILTISGANYGEGVALAGIFDAENCVAMTKFRFTYPDTHAYFVMRSDLEIPQYSERFWAGYNGFSDKIVFGLGGTQIAASDVMGWTKDTWYWIYLFYRYGACAVYTSTDGINFTRTLDGTYDWEAGSRQGRKLKGYFGLHSYVEPGHRVDYAKLFVAGFRKDWTIEELAYSVARRAGVMKFEFDEPALFDDFERQDLGPAYQVIDGTWYIQENCLRCDPYWDGTEWRGLIYRIDRKYKDVVVEWDMALVSYNYSGIVLRAGENRYYSILLKNQWYDVANKHELEVYVYKNTGTGKQKIFSYDFAPFVELVSAPFETILTYVHCRASVQGGFLSLWVEDQLLFTIYDESIKDEGYVGFQFWGDSSGFFDNVKIQALHQVVPLFLVDANTTYESGLQRLADLSGARYVFRNETLSFRERFPLTGGIDFKETILSASFVESDLEWKSAIRVDGEACFATAFSRELIEKEGWRPDFASMGELVSAEECLLAAEKQLRLNKYKRKQYDFTSIAQVALEPFDVIHIENPQDEVDKHLFVTNLSFSFSKEPPSFIMDVGLEERL